MTNMEKYINAFKESLEIDDSIITDELAFDSIPEWDSVGHMRLMASLEDTFDIMFETEDIMDFSSLGKGKEILKKYNVDL
ncbi:acyl carrier protein [Anaerovibrio lipolyticus]|uniref:acyl carrier protein n=1 Tax=Anaerovibrio lipolyticus TaxID=82374 RepID=UPI000484D891|nr:acyl carrier protein [Anaerovibrio lipolyticus]